MNVKRKKMFRSLDPIARLAAYKAVSNYLKFTLLIV